MKQLSNNGRFDSNVYSAPSIRIEELRMQAFLCLSGETTENYQEGPVYEEETVFGEV